jgi:hypothetical protein
MKSKSKLKTLTTILVSVVLIVLMIAQVTKANAAEPTLQEKGLAFLTDVAKLDMAKYAVKAEVHDGPSGTQFARYILESNGSRISIIHNVGIGYISFSINPEKGSPLFVQAKTTLTGEAKDILERYGIQYSALYVKEMCNSLDTFSAIENGTTTRGDVTIETYIEEVENVRLETITWSKTVNGIPNRHDIVSLTFRNGKLYQFCDSWNRYKIGNADINVDREKAISIAKEEVQKTWWTSGNTTVSNVNIVDKSILANVSLAPREDNKLYPIWEIRMGLDKVYPGGVTSITVTVKADTGEVAGTFLGAGYGLQSAGNPETSPPLSAPPSTINPENQQSARQNILPPMVAVFSIMVLAMAIVALAIKKRRSK